MVLGYKKKYTLEANYQDVLKCLAIVTMILDHIGLYFFETTIFLRIIGRLAMPIFVFFAGYNFTKSPSKEIFIYGILLELITQVLVVNASSQIIINIIYTLIKIVLGFTFFYFGYLYIKISKKDWFKAKFLEISIISEILITTIFSYFHYKNLNILTSIYLGQIYIKIFLQKMTDNPKKEQIFWIHVVILSLLSSFFVNSIEYGLLSIVGMLIGWNVKNNIIPYKRTTLSIFLLTCFMSNVIRFQLLNQNLIYPVIYTLLQVLLYFLLIKKNFYYQTPVNFSKIRFISRNALFIYLSHLLVIDLLRLLI